MKAAPKQDLHELDALLATRPPEVAARIRRAFDDLRPCVMLRTERASTTPIRGRLLDRMFGKPAPRPILPALASKYGGIPYAEREAEISGGTFLGQINFAEAVDALRKENFPIPHGMPHEGLLAVDRVENFDPPGNPLNARTRWYPAPEKNRLCDTTAMPSAGKFEAAISFGGSWSLQGIDWFAAVPEDDGELWEYMNDYEAAGIDEDADAAHKLFGHANEVLNEHYGFTPAPGRSALIRDYALIWRIAFDNAAGFSWGTNWLYVIIHNDDLRDGAFQNAIVTAANA
jgi:hypothetical protein